MARNAALPRSWDITRATLGVLFIVVLTAACFWILRPFLTAVVWAGTIVIATWPLLVVIQARLWGRRGLAVVAMTLLLLLVLVFPLSVAVVNVVDRGGDTVSWVRSVATVGLPAPPAWLDRLPLVGPTATARWQEIAAAGPGAVSARVAPHARVIVAWLIAQAGSVGLMAVELLLTLIICAVLYATGEQAANGLCLFARRLAGRHGEDAMALAARAIRGVALGVVVTALIQAILAGIGLAVSGVPAAIMLAAAAFMLCVAQVGPGLVLIPAIIWLFWQGQSLWGSILIVWSIFVCTIDNVIRPILIKKGADLPLLLIFAGVIGGLIAFGVIGLFVGPVLLAVAYTLIQEWVTQGEADAVQGSDGGME